MHYVIQENTFREPNYDSLEKSLKRLGLTYTTVRCFPFVDKISDIKDVPEGEFDVDDIPDYDPKSKNIFCFGAIKLARVAADLGWRPGSMMNSNHDFNVYSKHWKNHLLNGDSEIIKLTENMPWRNGEKKFIRPTKDTKSFTGALFDEEQWKIALEYNLKNFKNDLFNENTLIQVSSPKAINKEIRFWVVGGKVIDGSTYRVLDRHNIDGDIFEEEKKFAQNRVDEFQLNDAFVIDICDTPEGLKIVEAGCINCAGFYNVDLQRTIMALEDLFDVS